MPGINFEFFIGSAIVSQLRRGAPFGYGLLAAAVFACFSYPWDVLPLRLLFVVLLAGTCSKRVVPIPGRGHVVVLLALAGCLVCWTGLYSRYARRVEARRQWSEVRVWPNSGRYDYLVEDGPRHHDALQGDFRFLYDYGYALHKTGDYRQSNEILCEGMRISSDPMFWNIAGRNYEMLGDVAAAEEAYLHAHHMIPDRVYPLYLLAKLYLADGQTEKAYAAARRVIAHKPKMEMLTGGKPFCHLVYQGRLAPPVHRNAANGFEYHSKRKKEPFLFHHEAGFTADGTIKQFTDK